MSSPDLDSAAERAGSAGETAAPVARAVAEDLEAIFPAEAPPRAPSAHRLTLGAVREPRADGKGRWRERQAASLGALIAAACIGVSAGALFARGGAPAKPAPPPASPGVPISVAQPALPEPGPLASSPSAPAVQPPPLAEAAVTAAAPSVGSLRETSTPGKAGAHRRLAQVAAGCRNARCDARSVMAADARLRRAYAAAEHAGVSRPVLAAYRSEWGRLRRRAPRQPALVAARYRAMASDLNHLATHQRIARAEPYHTGPWRRFRTQLAALWR